MTKINRILLMIVAALAACSCRSHEVAYLSDAQRDTAVAIMEQYATTILPGDQIYIHVSSLTPQSVIPFNQETHKVVMESNSLDYLDNTQRAVVDQSKNNVISESQKTTTEVTGYFVTERGTINFPVFGEIMVAGITHDSLCRYIEQRLKGEGYVNDPQVSCRLMNFRVTVVGEVRNPQQIHVAGTRLTVLEALAICGDLTDYGQRNNLTVVRTENGVQTLGEIDLTKREMLDSPYYYLHNNDIVYVEPDKRRKRQAVRDPNWPRYVSIGVNVWSIVRTNINIIRRSKK